MANEPVVTICGNVASDPDLRFLSSGVAVCNFTVAATPRVKQGESWSDGETMWVRCAVWRETAEHVAESIEKGCRVLVHGRLKVRSWEQDGQKRTGIEMDIEHVGPELRYATAKVIKAQRGSDRPRPSGPSEDPWLNTDSQAAPF